MEHGQMAMIAGVEAIHELNNLILPEADTAKCPIG
jgi:hypothetical protein